MNANIVYRLKNPLEGEVWLGNNQRYSDSIRVKSRPLVITRVNGEEVEFYRCTSNANVPGAYHIQDPISAGLYKETFVILKKERGSIKQLGHRFGVLSKFDKEALGELQGGWR